ncbi:fructosamine kinase family protein [Nocardia sp. NPDC006630]|uniref:fructosamine kinase family protein n=1 Tax=Nocardia sp. NPDC006630 TaxID=3157181 RepID=UPI0033A456B2
MDVAARLCELTGVPVGRLTSLGRHHAWALYRGELADGRSVFVKAAPDDAESSDQSDSDVELFTTGGVFAAEAAGLRWLAEADAAIVPPVIADDDRMLVLPWLAPESASPAAAAQFGRALAELHGSSPATYGAPWPGFIATLPLDNSPTAGEWGSWYAERRLAPYLPAAEPHLGRDGIRLIERVIQRIGHLSGPPEPPSRIHGDLWSGNVHWSGQRALLIDPAGHGGHRETDLAMLALFGAPHLDLILAAYRESAPLASGWRQRIPLHQLHPLLVHVVLFGGSYRGMLLAAAASALAA